MNRGLVDINRVEALVVLKILPVTLENLNICLLFRRALPSHACLRRRKVHAHALNIIGLAQVGQRSTPSAAHIQDPLARLQIHQPGEEIHLRFLAFGIGRRVLPDIARIDLPGTAQDRKEKLGRLLVVDIRARFVFVLGVRLKHLLLGRGSRPLCRRRYWVEGRGHAFSPWTALLLVDLC